MTYHDALMTQLTSLVKIVRTLRERLKAVDETDIKVRLIETKWHFFIHFKFLIISSLRRNFNFLFLNSL